MSWNDVLKTIEESASQQRQEGRTVFSAIAPIASSVSIGSPHMAIQDLVSETVHRVESRGWKLDQVSAYTTSRECDFALLVFRAAGS
ncbi:hypothetical protein ACIHFD_61855 [Nonomuraea sp. NPDC051941]|uniref:hypothetical protein n=1 Tax=Nonomuraea sp. NPDC051941 TaxID=3364373 RepID=UPI0037C59C00